MATLDLLTSDEAAAAINTTAPSTDLDAMVSGISAQIDALCGPVVARDVTETYDGGKPLIWLHRLRQSPVLSITTVTEYDSGAATVLTAESETTVGTYLIQRTAHFVAICRRSAFGDSTFAAGRQNVVVVASAGRYDDTATVGAEFKEAAKSILRAQWQQEAPRWAQSPQFIDDSENGLIPSYVSVTDMVRRRLPNELPEVPYPRVRLMGTTSVVPAFKAALLAALDAATTVQVCQFWPGPSTAEEGIYIGVTDGLMELSALKTGRQRRREKAEVSVICQTMRAAATPTDADDASDRVFELLAVLEDVLSDDGAMAGTVEWAVVSAYSEQTVAFETGYASRLTVNVSVTGRLL